MAGIIVGIVALPLAIAFGIASGVSPEKGLFTAIIAGFIISFLGGSKVQIGGPTGAFIVIVYGIVQEFGVTGLTIATILAGVMLIAMGLLKLGAIIKFYSLPHCGRFYERDCPDHFWYSDKRFIWHDHRVDAGRFYQQVDYICQNIQTTNLAALAVGILSIVIIIFTPKFSKKIPGL